MVSMALKISETERLARFWSRVSKTDTCWDWTGGKFGNGYAAVSWDGRTTEAHRISWFIAHGPIPDGLWVLHRCDRPICVNPEHLFLGTPADNSRDRDVKGHYVSGIKAHPECAARGERNGGAKLTEDQVAVIRSSKEIARVLAHRYGVHKQTIYNIKWGKIWRHLKSPPIHLSNTRL